ncbi:sigma factor [Paraclostridium sordellii]|uniref:Sigma-70 family RNA polymerase sigma factor n=1 Tax=Paraclostridium sordellii TaxID=1505 RepID=A0A0C7G6H2_PARSO|nr:sigma factor [Paeniclostridium sordellii]CEN78262.1 sigma-70 family RNA polymerase sigma factor [[Clostridium] sordellii] [Paeniclostridium sordellii]CEQ03353.1 sigma-70 family RNA polymerase sigma factor [[Clostridium] sordellii] [Paeniclostridium sordellii]
MNKQENINSIISYYINLIFRFLLKRIKTKEGSEDLYQEIIIKGYKALNNIDNIYSLESCIWKIVHNTIANYYRGKSREAIEINIDDIVDILLCSK